MALLAVLAGLLIAAGALAVIAGLIPSWPAQKPVIAHTSLADRWARLSRRPAGRRGRQRDAILLVSVVAGFLLSAMTGWVILIPLLPAIALGLPYLLTLPKSRDIELLEALDRWVRQLSSTLSTGRSITDAIRLSRRSAPALIADELGILIGRLNNRWETKDALLRFADDLGSPDSDAVIAALILAANRGSDGAAATLLALADSIQSQLKGRRVIETERAKPYIVVRQVTGITCTTLIIAFVIGHSFFAPYGTPVGQLILSVLIALYVGSLLLMRRRAMTTPRERILTGARA